MLVCLFVFAYDFKALLAAGNSHCSKAAPTFVSAVVLHVRHWQIYSKLCCLKGKGQKFKEIKGTLKDTELSQEATTAPESPIFLPRL